MSQPNFESMPESDLWNYVLENRSDDQAFYALIDRAKAKPRVKVRSMEHLAELIKAKQKASEERSD
ncbi:DUF6887 family protein [Phormidesmis sp. 146-35]